MGEPCTCEIVIGRETEGDELFTFEIESEGIFISFDQTEDQVDEIITRLQQLKEKP